MITLSISPGVTLHVRKRATLNGPKNKRAQKQDSLEEYTVTILVAQSFGFQVL